MVILIQYTAGKQIPGDVVITVYVTVTFIQRYSILSFLCIRFIYLIFNMCLNLIQVEQLQGLLNQSPFFNYL